MLILFDHSTPAPLRYALKGHVVLEAVERGWERLVDGELLAVAEASGYQVFVTADKNTAISRIWRAGWIAIVVPGNAQWPVLRRYVDRVVAAVEAASPGSYAEVEVPFR